MNRAFEQKGEDSGGDKFDGNKGSYVGKMSIVED